jgi:L-lactate dehydrogenase complex protein LldE
MLRLRRHFSLKQPEISGAMVEDKVKALKATGAERVVSADCGCLMNILGHAAWKDQQAGRKTPACPASTLPPSCCGGRPNERP